MTCCQVHRHLLAWLEGELDEATWLAVAQHVDTCERCRAEAQRQRQLIATLRAVAHSDGVPSIPPRLWRQLAPQRKRLPSFVSVFVTACLAFVLGWHARSIASSITPLPQTTRSTERSAIVTQHLVSQRRCSLADIPLRAPRPSSHRKCEWQDQDAEMLTGKKSLTPAPTALQRPQPLTLNGATASVWGERAGNWQAWRANRRSPLPSPFQLDERRWRFDEGKGAERLCPPVLSEGQVFETDDEVVDAFAGLCAPTDTTAEPSPYRIFVQVTDPQTQRVRTVRVDTTDPHHIVAEWQQ